MAVGNPHFRAVEFVVLVPFAAGLAADLRDVMKRSALIATQTCTRRIVVAAVIDFLCVDRAGVENAFPFRAEHEIFHTLRIREHFNAPKTGPRLDAAGIAARARLGQREGTDLSR